MSYMIKFRACLIDGTSLVNKHRMDTVPRVGESVLFGSWEKGFCLTVTDVVHIAYHGNEFYDTQVEVIFNPVTIHPDELKKKGWE